MNTESKTSSTPRRRGALRFLPAVTVGAWALTLAGAASAKPEFVEIVLDTVGMECPPPCTLCHTSSNGGGNTVRVTGFTSTIRETSRALGTAKGNNGTVDVNLASALEYMDKNPCPNTADPGCAPAMPGGACTAKCNADASGKDDIAELRDGTSPDDATEFVCPAYGCGAHVAPTRPNRPSDGTAILGALGALLVLVRRFRR